ncbi:MAG: antibiotic biosynthesis monooxygenase [Vulcanimicrobiaceae bacterium]
MPDAIYSLVVTFTGDDVGVLETIAEQTTLLAQTVLLQFNGFLASRVLLSREGHRVVIVSDWGSRESLTAAQADPSVTAVIAKHVEGTQSVDVHIYERYATVMAAPAE